MKTENAHLIVRADKRIGALTRALKIMEEGAYEHWINLDQEAYGRLQAELKAAREEYDMLTEAIWSSDY